MAPRPCRIEGCTGLAGVPGTAKGLCSKHYGRLRTSGDPLLTPGDLNPKPKRPTVCDVDGCEEPRYARDWCRGHYLRWHRKGDLGSTVIFKSQHGNPCAVDGCDDLVKSQKFCGKHYQRWMKYGDPLAGGPFYGLHRTCTVPDCTGDFYAKALCRRHYFVIHIYPRRRDAEKAAPGFCTSQQLADRIAYFGARCWVCGGASNQVDHVKPLAVGGSNWPSNLRPICGPCNSRKGAKWKDVHGHHLPLTTTQKVSI